MNDHNNSIELETAMTTTTMTMIQALRSAMDVMLERDDNVVVFGQDVGYFGGVFRCTEGLQSKYGTSRVFDAPISESGIVGVAVGMGAYGLRPVAEIQFADYVYPATDQIVLSLLLTKPAQEIIDAVRHRQYHTARKEYRNKQLLQRQLTGIGHIGVFQNGCGSKMQRLSVIGHVIYGGDIEQRFFTAGGEV